MRSKNPELTDALTGRFTSHHRNRAELYLHRIYAHTADIEALSARLEEAIEPFRPALERLISFPGFSTTIAEVFIAETEADMTECSPARGTFHPGPAPPLGPTHPPDAIEAVANHTTPGIITNGPPPPATSPGVSPSLVSVSEVGCTITARSPLHSG